MSLINQSHQSNAVVGGARAQGAVRALNAVLSLGCRIVVAGVDNQNANEQAVDGCAVAGLGEKNRAVSS